MSANLTTKLSVKIIENKAKKPYNALQLDKIANFTRFD